MTSLNGVRKRRLTAKETSIANCEVLDEKYRIAVQGIFVPRSLKIGENYRGKYKGNRKIEISVF